MGCAALLTVQLGWHIVYDTLFCIGIFDGWIVVCHEITLQMVEREEISLVIIII